MTSYANTIEDLLEILAGLKQASKIDILPSDTTIMHSIARQVFKGTALTDRQYNLMKEKLQIYKDQFTALDYNFDQAIDNLRQPLRTIDRSKYITVVSHSEMLGEDRVYESYKVSWQWIKVRFPFNKRDITSINTANMGLKSDSYYHEKGSHEHFFILNEHNAYNLINEFKNREFKIDNILFDIHRQVQEIIDNKYNYIPYVDKTGAGNLHKNAQLLIEDISDDVYKLADRHRRFGVVEINYEHNDNSLISTIAFRERTDVQIKPSEFSTNNLIEAIYKLDRFPLLVVLDENKAEDQLYDFYSCINTIVSNTEQSVLFRLEGDSNFNTFVKERQLNNWVDKNTKIVYINNNKLPKLCLSSEWKPEAAIVYDSKLNRNTDLYIRNNCDLIVYREEEMSPFRRYSRLYGHM